MPLKSGSNACCAPASLWNTALWTNPSPFHFLSGIVLNTEYKDHYREPSTVPGLRHVPLNGSCC